MTRILLSRKQLHYCPSFLLALGEQFHVFYTEDYPSDSNRAKSSTDESCLVNHLERFELKAEKEKILALTLPALQKLKELRIHYTQLIRELEIDWVVLVGDYLSISRPLLLASRDTKVPTVNLENTYHFITPKLEYFKKVARRHCYFSSDYVILDNAMEQAQVEENNETMNYRPKGKLITLGSMINEELYISKADQKRCGFRKNGKLVICLLIPWCEAKTPSRAYRTQIDEADAIERLLSEIACQNFPFSIEFTFKLHPNFLRYGVHVQVSEFFFDLLERYGIPGTVVADDLLSSIFGSDVVLCQRFTPLLWDAICLGKIAMIWQHQDYVAQLIPGVSLEDTNEIMRRKLLLVAMSEKDILRYLSDPMALEESIAERRKKLIEQHSFYDYNNKVENILEWLSERASDHGNSRNNRFPVSQINRTFENS